MSLLTLILAACLQQAQPPRPPAYFASTTPVEQLRHKQAVIDTAFGQIVVDLLPDAAPNHVAYFVKLASEKAYDGTTFHAIVTRGLIQGGDPVSKDPARRDQYGTGGLGVLRSEPSAEKHTRGALSAVLAGGKPDTAGAQFFICVVDQPSLDGRYTVFGRVVEGIRVVEKISDQPVGDNNRARDRIEVASITIRDRPEDGPEPFSTETVEELAARRVILETSLGAITLEMLPQKAPGHVRNFLRLVSLGVYDGMTFHRVAPGFVVQTGHLPTRREPLGERQEKAVRNLPPEFNDVLHEKGVVSMARLAEPSSASTSFFICLGRTPELDGQYTAFGRVVDGLPVVEAIEKAPRTGETPDPPVALLSARVEPVRK